VSGDSSGSGQIRVAGAHEATAITRIINAAFRKAESFFIDRDRIDLEKVQELQRSGKFLVSEDDGAIIACVYVEMRGEGSYLGLLAVDPGAQKAGVGSKLMSAAENHCRKAGSRFMDIQIVNLRRELPEFYHRRGYAETGTAPFTAGLNPKLPCHFVKMAKPLV
jgi:N-acetylglutamate synthase-like GNAT family acetyltransferase